MRRMFSRGWRVGGTLSLALAGLFLLTGALRGRATAVSDAPFPTQEHLWAEVGLNDAWYIVHSYTTAPPTAARASQSQLALTPPTVAWTALADRPGVLSATVTVSGSGSGTLEGWTAQPAPGGTFTPTLWPTRGLPGQAFTLTVDTAPYRYTAHALTLTRRIIVSALPTHSQALTATLYIDPHLPRLAPGTDEIFISASALVPGVYTRTVAIDNGGGYSLTWQAATLSGALTLGITPTGGLQGDLLTITADSRGLPTTTGIYTGWIVVSATPGLSTPNVVLDTPQTLTVRLQMVRQTTYLPQIVKQTSPPPPTEPPEVRAIWVTRYDWTSLYGPEGPADVDAIVSNVADAGFNTIFFQVRAHGDAYYTPGLEPWSARLNDAGMLGQDPGWDPLARMIEQAHARGIAVHAYVNVYPAWLGTTAPPADTIPQHPFWTWSYAYTWDDWRQWHQSGGVMALNSSYLWASPGVDGVRDHIVAVVSDIVARYAVDGVHLDLVRYAGADYSFDPPSNTAAGSAQTAARDQWQRDRVTDLVSRIHQAIGAVRPGTHLSAAVWFCYYADGCGYGLSSGYADYYQDSLGWLTAGAIDAIAPMLYGPTALESLSAWTDVMLQFQSAGGDVYPGISADFDNFTQIADRIQATRDAGTAGHAVFSYGAVELHDYWDDFASGPYAEP